MGLNERAKALRTRHRDQLGEFVLATGAAALPIDVLADALLAAAASDAATKEVWRVVARHTFVSPSAAPRAALAAKRAALRRVTAARHRLLAMRAGHDTRAWQVTRRERTRQLIELGGLIVKAGLVELTDDGRAVMFGILVEATARLRDCQREQQLLVWRRRGRRAFADDGECRTSTGDNHNGPEQSHVVCASHGD